MGKKRASIIVAILLLAVGFAAISTTLIINGGVKLGENTSDFDVIFTKASLDGKDVYANVIDSTKKIINFTTNDLKTLKQTSVLTYEVTNNSSNYDAEISINCKVKDGVSAKYTSIENVLEGNVTVIKAKETLNGTLTVTLNKTSTEEVHEEYTCEIVANASERENGENQKPENYTLIVDDNNNGVADIGDEIQVNGTSENFYVISVLSGTRVNALAKYNLNVGENKTSDSEGLQSIATKNLSASIPSPGAVAFSNSNGWEYEMEKDIDIELYDGPVKTAIDNYKKVISKATEIRLITANELNALGCTDSSCTDAPVYVYLTSYWVGTSVKNYSSNVKIVTTDGYFGDDNYSSTFFGGVRPVITIS